MHYYYMDATYILVLIGALLCMAASAGVKTTYNKYSKVRSMSGMTGAEVAARILNQNCISDVSIANVSGDLTDNFDPRNKTVNLSDAVYGRSSVAAIAVAAHECGHVMQHENGYLPLKIRSAILPAANIGSKAGVPIIILGIILGITPFANLGILIFSLAVLFQFVTLPVEFDASKRALVMLEEYGILAHEEIDGSRKVLRAAALTYVASAASAVLQLLRFVILANGNNRRRD
ncbi:MAG: zinc metallopeptidase [Butyrivibrio sp.]|nr:zinc metallopeptidase [Butyrivibrio sp.]